MHPSQAIPEPDDVLRHLDWVRGLALQLVGDPAEADDLRQEVWLLSQRLQKPIRSSLQGYLGGLLRNVVRDRRRTERTRSRYEESAALARARSTAAPMLVRQASVQQAVVERLMQLREPYRCTLLARYYEDLTPGEIAVREGIPLATVKTRLRRGLADLREDLAQSRSGPASASAPTLALLALHTWDPEVVAPQAAGGAGWVPFAVASLVLGTVGVGLAWRGLATKHAGIDQVELAGANQQGPSDLNRETASEGDGPFTREVQTSQGGAAPVVTLQGADSPTSPAPDPVSAPVQVVDFEGRAMPGVQVEFVRYMDSGAKVHGESVQTNKDGLALVKGIQGVGVLYCSDHDYLQLGFPAIEADAIRELTVAVLVQARSMEGQILSHKGEPLSGVRIEAGLVATFSGPARKHLVHASVIDFLTESGPDGLFHLQVPRASQRWGMMCQKVGYKDAVQVFAADAKPGPVRITMTTVTDPNVAFGVVVSDTGQRLDGAWVADGTTAVRSSASGEFQLGPVPADADLWVGAPGFASQSIPRPKDLHGVRLVLSREALSIQGRVSYPDGQGAAGVDVRLLSAQPVGTYHYAYSGRAATTVMFAEGFGYPMDWPVPQRVHARTDSDGNFHLKGLLARDYDLEVVDPGNLQRVDCAGVAAGATGVQIALFDRPGPVTGHVRTPQGDPVAGARVRSVELVGNHRPGPQVVTDDSGRFRFESLAPESLLLMDGGLPWVHLGTLVLGSRFLEIEVEPAARVTLLLDLNRDFGAGSRRPDQAVFRDKAGRPIPFRVDDVLKDRRERWDFGPNDLGIASPLPALVSIRARELVLLDSSGPLLVLPLDLKAGQDLHLTE